MKAKYQYEYPPSESITQLGDIIKESHFLANGKAVFTDGFETKCQFEVAYTKSSQVVCVVYIDFEENNRKHNPNWIRDTEITQLEGKDIIWGLDIVVYNLKTTQWASSDLLSLRQIKYSLLGTHYKVIAPNSPDPTHLAFLLTK